MNVNNFLLVNPFIDAYIQSDFIGKLIFISLILLSIISWVIIIYKIRLTYQADKFSIQFYNLFQNHKTKPLTIDQTIINQQKKPNPFSDLYSVLKRHTLDILTKNKKFGATLSDSHSSYLLPADIEFIDTHLCSTIASHTHFLDKNLFILSTIVSLGPFLGLLGTVWGILTTFSEMQAQASGNQAVLGGISLALATTVLGLLDAVPALIGYNYLKNKIHSIQTKMEGFSTEILASIEMQYRKVE